MYTAMTTHTWHVHRISRRLTSTQYYGNSEEGIPSTEHGMGWKAQERACSPPDASCYSVFVL